VGRRLDRLSRRWESGRCLCSRRVFVFVSCCRSALSLRTPTADSGMDLRAAPDPTKRYYSSSLFCSVPLSFCPALILILVLVVVVVSPTLLTTTITSLTTARALLSLFQYSTCIHCQSVPPSSGHLQLCPRALAYLPKPRCHSTTFSPAQNTFLSLSFLPHNHLTPTSISTQTPLYLVNASQSLAFQPVTYSFPPESHCILNVHRRFPNNHPVFRQTHHYLEADRQLDLDEDSHERSLSHLTPGSLPLIYQSPTCRHPLPADLPRSLSRQAQSPPRIETMHKKRSPLSGGLRRCPSRPRPRAPRQAGMSPRQGT
jgi:hypothetical protein